MLVKDLFLKYGSLKKAITRASISILNNNSQIGYFNIFELSIFIFLIINKLENVILLGLGGNDFKIINKTGTRMKPNSADGLRKLIF